MKALSRVQAWLVPLAAALLSLWPLNLCWGSFRQLFYFEDEWDLLDLWSKDGFGRWATATFAENFVPLFKLSWGGSVIAAQGNYFTLVALTWLNHALNVALLTRLLIRLGTLQEAALLAGIFFGLSPLNLETLGWTVQWSAVQSITFFLLGLFFLIPDERGTKPVWSVTGVALVSFASPLCFSRGVLTGLSLGGSFILHRRLRRWAMIAAAVGPAIAVASIVMLNAQGNHRHLGGAAPAILNYAFHYFGQSPLRLVLDLSSAATGIVVLLALLKVGLFLSAWLLSQSTARPVVTALITFDIGNALLLGIGRHHTGLDTAISSRYQYAALIVVASLAAIVLTKAVQRLPRRAAIAFIASAALTLFVLSTMRWPPRMREWSEWRGAEIRRALALPTDRAPDHFTRLPWMPNDRARELVREFNLH